MDKYLEASMSAFNVSKHCDHSSPQAFFDSYISRKKQIIEGKIHAAKNGSAVNKKKLDWEIRVTQIAIKQKGLFLQRAAEFIENTKGSGVVDRAEQLLQDLQGVE